MNFLPFVAKLNGKAKFVNFVLLYDTRFQLFDMMPAPGLGLLITKWDTRPEYCAASQTVTADGHFPIACGYAWVILPQTTTLVTKWTQ